MKGRSHIIHRVLLPLALLLCILLLWEAAVRCFHIPLYVLPAPSRILGACIEDFPVLSQHAAVTLQETALGLFIAVLLGMLFAIAMDRFLWLRHALYPLLVVSQTVPVIVLAPIFIIYLGFGLAPKVLIVVLMCFFPIVVSFVDGLHQVDARLVNLVRSYGAGTLRIYASVKIPAAAVSLFSGLKVAATYSISGAVVGEWLSSNSGLGYYMLRAKNGYMLDKVFASVLAVALLSLLMNGLVQLMRHIAMPYLRKA